MKTVTSYVHRVPQVEQRPDTRPGNYYVTAFDGPNRYSLLSGPYPNDHAAALADVDAVRALAQALDPKAVFYSFGTARMDDAYTATGFLNRIGKFVANTTASKGSSYEHSRS